MSFNMYIPTIILFGAGELNNLYRRNLPLIKDLMLYFIV